MPFKFELKRRIRVCKGTLAGSSDLCNRAFSINYLYQHLISQIFFPLVNYVLSFFSMVF